MKMKNIFHIDGSQGEGGGQIVRTALALAALLQKDVKISNIRANRKRPGLRPQHLVAVRALSEITQAETEGAHENSRQLFFAPRSIKRGDYRFVIKTAGSTSLVLMAILPPLLFAKGPSRITIEGGTHVPFSPPYHYLEAVFCPALLAMGGRVEIGLEKWGMYPEGGGAVNIRISPCQGLRAVQLTGRGRLLNLELLVALANLPLHIARREREQVEKIMGKNGFEVKSGFVSVSSPGRGNVVFLKGVFERTAAGFSALGRKGKPAEKVAEEVCREWLAFIHTEAAIDPHLADQLLVYMALAKGKSALRTTGMTSHLLTNIGIIERFLPVHFDLDPEKGLVEVNGVGYL